MPAQDVLPALVVELTTPLLALARPGGICLNIHRRGLSMREAWSKNNSITPSSGLPQPVVASMLVQALEACWRAIRERHSDLPARSGGSGSSGSRWRASSRRPALRPAPPCRHSVGRISPPRPPARRNVDTMGAVRTVAPGRRDGSSSGLGHLFRTAECAVPAARIVKMARRPPAAPRPPGPRGGPSACRGPGGC